MAFNNKKKNANYISAKESRAIAGETARLRRRSRKKKQKAYSGGGICDKDEESGELR